MRILVLGKNGQLGRCLLQSLAPLGEILAFGSSDVDFRESRLLRELVRETFPDLIVNAAAYTAVDKAESDVDTATAVNGTAPGVLAEEAENIGAGLVHYSSDYVFNGNSQRPYTEDDEPNPLSAYGRSKLLGESAIQETDAGFVILRTTWVFGSFGYNFFTTMLRLCRERTEMDMVDDQKISPTWVRWIADATALILSRIDPSLPHAPSKYLGEHRGVYNLAALGETTPFGFAQEILRQDPWQHEHRVRAIRSIRLVDYRAVAKRPPHCLLDSTKARERFGVQLEDWNAHLKNCWSGVTASDAASFREPGLMP